MDGCLKHYSSRCTIHLIFLVEAVHAIYKEINKPNDSEEIDLSVSLDYELDPDHILEEMQDPATSDAFSDLIRGPVTRESLQKYYDIIYSWTPSHIEEAKRLSIRAHLPNDDDECDLSLTGPSEYLHRMINRLVPDDGVVVHELGVAE